MSTRDPYLDIVIDGGKIKIDAVGFEGKGCHELAAAFQTLGDVEEYRRKPDYFRADANADSLRGTVTQR